MDINGQHRIYRKACANLLHAWVAGVVSVVAPMVLIGSEASRNRYCAVEADHISVVLHNHQVLLGQIHGFETGSTESSGVDGFHGIVLCGLHLPGEREDQ